MFAFFQRLRRIALPLCLFAVSAAAQAGALLITIDTRSLAGTGGQLAFDLVDGGAPGNSITLGSFTGDAILGASSAMGGVAGQLPSMVTLSDTAFFSEYLQSLVFGDSLSFIFESSDIASSGFAPDAFSVFVLGTGGLPLGTTTDPTGANALFIYDIGVPQGLQVFQSTVVVVTAQAPPTGVPEPAGWLLVMTALLALVLARPASRATQKLCQGVALAFALLAANAAWAADLTAVVAVSKTGFVLNRTTNTFDTTVTVRNTSANTLTGPMQLTLENVAPANVALYNTYGRNAAGKDYVLLPLPDGVLAAGASTTVPVKLINTGRVVTDAQISVQGTRLTATNSVSLKINAFFASGPDGNQKGASVGAGYRVQIDGYNRGLTDASGGVTVTVPVSAKSVSVTQSPNAAGSALLGSLVAGQAAAVEVLVGDGGEVYAEGVLRFDQVQQLLLPRNASRISLRFLSDEKPVRLGLISFAQASNVAGQTFDLTSLFSIQPDGSVAASPAAFYQAFSGFAGKAVIRLDGEDVDGAPFSGTAAFYFSDYRTRVQLVAPPSRPGLALGGVRIVANILNTDVFVRAEADAAGFIALPDLPRGNISLESITTADGVTYTGKGTAVLNKNSLVKLTMRAPVDVLNSVPAISVEPLPAGLAAPTRAQVVGDAAEAAVYTPAQLAERQAYAGSRAGAAATARSRLFNQAPLLADPTFVTINVVAGARDAQIEQSAQLKLPKGTKKATLTYTVATAEYPTYVLQQSIYNDVWSLSVLEASGTSLFDITRQINSQLTQEPVWLADGTTGVVKREIDVSALTTSADVNVILRASAVNIGDGILPTAVNAKLDAAQQLTIGTITPDTVNANNDGSYYSIPRPGATNTNQRTFDVAITKPAGSTLTAISVELRDGAGTALMQVLQDTAPGQAGVEVISQDDTSASLRLRATVQSPASTIAGTPPPTRDLGYRIIVKGTDQAGADIRDEKDVNGKRSLWRMPDVIGRYGSRDAGGDDWAARGTYNWMAANAASLRQVNDVSGEHGINLGHVTHARGTDIDMFHFYLFPGVTTAPGGGAANFNSLRADVIAAFGTLGVPVPPPGAVAARNRVNGWITASRTGLTTIAASPAVSAVIYCSGPAAQGLSAGWCRTLLTAGTATRTVPVPNAPPQVQVLDFGTGAYTNAKMANNNVHNDHIHITLAPGQIGE